MATPANLTYTDIETRCANQLRIPTSDTTQMTRLRAIINEVYREVYTRYDWPWLVKRQVINTVDEYETGTAAVTNGETTVTLSTAPATSLGSFAGRVFTVPSDPKDSGALYRIATHTAGNSALILDAAFTGETNASASYTVYTDTYDLAADTGKVLAIRRYGHPWPLRLIGPQHMHDIKIVDTTEGKPEVATVHEYDTSGDPTSQRQLIVHPFPDDTYRLEIHYKQQLNTELSSTTQPFMPDEFRQVLIYGTLAQAYPIMLNDTERGQWFQAKYADALALMVNSIRERGADAPKIEPIEGYRQFYRSGRRETGQRADLGAYFDRWPIEPP